MIAHLEQMGHIVKVVSYDRRFQNLKHNFNVFETEELHIASSDNCVSKVKTFTENLKRLPDFKRKLSDYPAQDNSLIKAKLKELLDSNCSIAWDYHRKRLRLIPKLEKIL